MAEPKDDGGKSDRDKAKEAQMARAKKYGIKPHEGGNVTKPSEYADVPDDKFADPVNYAYPITPEYVMAAYRYFAKPKNQEVYSPEERKIVAKRIYDALPDKYKAEAKKVFKLDETGGSLPPNPIDGDGVPPHKPDDVDTGKFHEGGNTMDDNKKPEGVISMAEYEALQEKVRVQERALRRMQLSEKVNGYLFNEATGAGKILPAQRDTVIDLMMSMDDEQVKKFSEFIESLPDAVKFNDEKGHGHSAPKKTRAELVEERAAVLMSEKGLDYRTAIVQADAEISEKL
jgi:hypothetical protein